MKTRPLSQPLSPTPAKGSAPGRLRTFGLAFVLALFFLLLAGDAAHADDALEAGPPAATGDTGGASTEAAGPADVADHAEETTSPDLLATLDTGAPAPTAVNVETGDPLPVVVEAPADALLRSGVEASAASPGVIGSTTAVVPSVTREIARRWSTNVLAASRVTIQAHAAPVVHQCNADTYPTGAGWEASCTVTIENTLGSDGATSSRVTTTWCLAAAGVLPPQGCTTNVTTTNSLVTSVDQCNGILAGGSNVTCRVEVVNNVPHGTPTTDVTVNQCVGSGQGGVSPGGPPTDCDPVNSSTSGATVTQCNGSANGGGAPERVQCAATGNTMALPVTVNQCNGSTAAGSTVTCEVTYTNNFAAAATQPGGAPITAPGPSPSTIRAPSPPSTPTPVVPFSSTPATTDLEETARFTPAASSTSSGRSITDASSSTGTSLPATGPKTSTSGLLSAALLLLLLGALLLSGSTRHARVPHAACCR